TSRARSACSFCYSLLASGLWPSFGPRGEPWRRSLAGPGGFSLAVIGPGVHVDFARAAAQAARGGAADAGGQLPPLVVRRHDHEPPLLLALVDEVVDTVARPARPVLGSKVVEDDEVVPARVGRRLAVAVALAECVQPVGHVEEERGR